MPALSPEEAKNYAPILGAAISGLCAFLGAILGACAVIIVNLYQAKVKGRENLDGWLERYAITEGIEPVLFFIHNTKNHHLTRIGVVSMPESAPLPTSELQKICSILGDEAIILAVSGAQMGATHCENPDVFTVIEEMLNELGAVLEELEPVFTRFIGATFTPQFRC